MERFLPFLLNHQKQITNIYISFSMMKRLFNFSNDENMLFYLISTRQNIFTLAK